MQKFFNQFKYKRRAFSKHNGKIIEYSVTLYDDIEIFYHTEKQLLKYTTSDEKIFLTKIISEQELPIFDCPEESILKYMLGEPILTVRTATIELFKRYKKEFPLNKHERELIEEAIENHHKYPLDKLSRWLGFIQGTLIERGYTSIDEERNVTRPLFQEAYQNEGIESPSFSTGEQK